MTPERYKEHKERIGALIAEGEDAEANEAFWVAASEMTDTQATAMMQMVAMDLT